MCEKGKNIAQIFSVAFSSLSHFHNLSIKNFNELQFFTSFYCSYPFNHPLNVSLYPANKLVSLSLSSPFIPEATDTLILSRSANLYINNFVIFLQVLGKQTNIYMNTKFLRSILNSDCKNHGITFFLLFKN